MKHLVSARPAITATSRLERVARRAARDHSRQERLAARQRSAEAPPSAFTEHEARVERLTGCHRVTLTGVDWVETASRGEMAAPVRTHARELKARKALTAYQPNWIDRMFGLEQGKRRELAALVATAASADEADFQAVRRAAEAHNADIQLARKLLDLDVPTLEKALPTRSRLGELGELWEGMSLSVPSRGTLSAVVGGYDLEDMPDEAPTTLPTGKAVFKPLPSRERHELHRAHLCSVAVRVAAELMAALPVDAIEVAVECELADPAGGERDRRRVLQLSLARPALADLKLDRLEAVAAVAALGGRMEWTQDAGFAPLAPPAPPVALKRTAMG